MALRLMALTVTFLQAGPVSSADIDVNGDDFDDIIIGAPFANPSGPGSTGESYVIFETDFTTAALNVGTLEPFDQYSSAILVMP